ncbi:hypothetical protein BST97_02970 [Nonlabens spongiae]|uniref:Membrane protein YfhO n=1 Tax=Nonlabens spongiae TaxID=331648 RepID=A0A1W6MHQ7_9FLAO|nr:YfhO family protein [Nonlabens spongiae]ARN77046.1 hypothetical protein BST97_02970 [Nonlabens spongiae]
MKIDFKKIIPHAIAFLLFIIAALAYFHPVLSGKKIYQSDIVQYRGNARQIIDFRENQGEELLWTDTIFGGMPTYQLGVRYEYDLIDQLDRVIRFLPRPADYLFLYLISFYILGLVLKIPWKYSILGALFFGFSTYMIIILGVGHNSKAHAIAYMPMVLASIIMVFQKRYLVGFICMALFMALQIQANHLQMTYYLMFAVIILGIVYFIDAYKKGLLKHYFKSIGILVGAVVIALGTNAANLLTTSEYTGESTRGKSPISINAQGESISTDSGLDYDYITQYSYGFVETINMLIPRFVGGGSGMRPEEDSNTVAYLTSLGLPKAQAMQFAESGVPMYWGDQPIVEAPAYMGAGVIFLAILALFLLEGKLIKWAVGVSLFAVIIAWGKNVDWLTQFLIGYMPLWNKFRAITSVLVLIELCFPLLAMAGLYCLFVKKIPSQEKLKAVLYSSAIVGGLCALFAVLGKSIFDFTSPYDINFIQEDQLGLPFVKAIREDRWVLMRDDSLRSLLIIGLITGILYLTLKEKIKQNLALVLIGAVCLFDLVDFNLNYVNADSFISAREYDNIFPEYGADKAIQKDPSHFRVYDLTTDPVTSSRASNFHHALGGYHPAKPARFNNLVDFYLRDEQGRMGVDENTIEILSMFNVKYFIQEQEDGVKPIENPLNLGPAWFVNEVIPVSNQNEEILSLRNLKGDAVAFITQEEQEKINLTKVGKDSSATIELTSYHPEKLVYSTQNSKDGLAVFAEMYYPHGWKATVDGQEVPIARVNYTLRGVMVPAGNHEIELTFEPQVVKTGTYVMLGSNILLVICLGLIVFWKVKNKE